MITKIAGVPVSQLVELEDQLEKHKGKVVQIEVTRGSSSLTLALPPSKTGELYRGIYPPTRLRKLPFIPAVRDSIDQNWKMVKYAWVVISRLFRMQGSVKELSGPISIARISGEMLKNGWKAVVYLMAGIRSSWAS